MEIVHRISEDHPTKCPTCNSKDFEQKLTNGNFTLTGPKWFKNTGQY